MPKSETEREIEKQRDDKNENFTNQKTWV